MRLVDTSAWIHALRPDGDPATASRVRSLLEAGEAAWCPMIELELWSGARGAHERRVLEEMGRFLVRLEITDGVWRAAFALARAARQKGKTVPSTDILIAACARTHSVELEHADEHFIALAAV
ncbi:MAG: PIN domain-containing protein [Armatimonadota bacterium]